MALELHVWGPAFGLPSIDAQCLATIAYFVVAIPEKEGEWTLVADSDPLVSPTHELPALRAGARWVSGFRNIVDFLKQYSNGEWDLDHWLDKKEKADCTAYSSFIESHGQSLIDLSLYVSSENYTAATRPAYGSLLSWPNQWILPTKIRDSAKARTDHLGLSNLDLDAAEEERQQSRQADNVAAAQIPKSLVKPPRDTVSSLLGKTAQQSRIRLDGMAGAFGAPLEQLRNGKHYLLSDELVSSVDCLALGYLSLAVVPDLPYAWLRDAVESQGAGLVEYTERLRRHCFGGAANAVQLPWQAAERVTLGRAGLRAWDSVLDSIPVVGDVRASRRLQQAGREMMADREEQGTITEIARAQRYNTYLSVAGVVGGVGLLAWSMVNAGWLTVVSAGKHQEDEESEGDSAAAWGEAGSMLGI